ncbi:hypothetical protein ACFQNE_10785 [Gordonia phosphorivorans]|uniref:Uncharacterized protein n=1 Tax=Gordonia phosphorivorans TaxID=1056982 RepID=A0ABV6HAD2_9ACTN
MGTAFAVALNLITSGCATPPVENSITRGQLVDTDEPAASGGTAATAIPIADAMTTADLRISMQRKLFHDGNVSHSRNG